MKQALSIRDFPRMCEGASAKQLPYLIARRISSLVQSCNGARESDRSSFIEPPDANREIPN